MRRKQGIQPPVVGGSALLVIFAVLSLTIFAMLSLTTVLADQRLSQHNAQAVSAYYDADAQAEKILGQLRAGEVPDAVTLDGNRYQYACPISDTLELQIEVEKTGRELRVLKWQTVSTADWETEETWDLWDGN